MKTLKEKFESVDILVYSDFGDHSRNMEEKEIEDCTNIAEEFAIGFGDFCRNITSTHKDIIRKYPDATIEELLEIYKKEKGL